MRQGVGRAPVRGIHQPGAGRRSAHSAGGRGGRSEGPGDGRDRAPQFRFAPHRSHCRVRSVRHRPVRNVLQQPLHQFVPQARRELGSDIERTHLPVRRARDQPDGPLGSYVQLGSQLLRVTVRRRRRSSEKTEGSGRGRQEVLPAAGSSQSDAAGVALPQQQPATFRARSPG